MVVPPPHASDPFYGIRLKLKRARQHIKELESDFGCYLDSEPYRPTIHCAIPSRILTLSVKAEKIPDPMWGVRLGEVVHNVRSALDHVVWELVILTTGRPPALPTKNQFPIINSKDGFVKRGVPEQLRCVRQDAVDLIQSKQPYYTGEGVNSPLWHLAELSNSDKHRTLHLTGTLIEGFQFTMPPTLEPITYTVLEQRAEGPIQQDAVLWRGRLSGSLDWPFTSDQVKGDFLLDIAFDEATPCVGRKRALDTVANATARAETVLSEIARDIFKLTL